MNLGLTVNELYEACKEQIDNGNGNKHIVISSDDEGNSYHTLYYLFTDDESDIEYCLDNEDSSKHNKNNCVILG